MPKETDLSKKLWEQLEPYVYAMFTRRILAFHDALVKRGQIPEAPPADGPIEYPAVTD
jgi:hypothetical protein